MLALVLAMLVAVPVGAVVAIPAIRVSGVFLALATLGFGILAQDVFYTRSFMFGSKTLGIAEPRPDISIGGLNLSTDKGFYYLLLAITVLVVAVVTAITMRRPGRLMEAMADSPLGLETHGASSTVLKVIVFCITAAIAALAGALTGMLFHYGLGSFFDPFSSLTLVVLTVVITLGSPWYAVLGAVGTVVVAGYLHGSNVTNGLTLLFGVSACTAAFATKIGGTPVQSSNCWTAWVVADPGRWGRAAGDSGG